jgi:hypothetical protein
MSTPLPTEMTVRNFLTKELEKRAVKVQTEWSYTTPIGRLAPDMRLMNGAEYVVETKLGAESKLLDAIVRLYDYSKYTDAKGAFAILFPEELRRRWTTEMLEKMAVDPKLKYVAIAIFKDNRPSTKYEGNLSELADWIASQVLKPLAVEADTGFAIKVLTEAVEAITLSVKSLKSKDLEEIFGGRTVFENILQYEEGHYPLDEMRQAATYLLVNQIIFYHVLSTANPQLQAIDEGKIGKPLDLLRYFEAVLKIDYTSVFGFDVASKLPESATDIIKRVIVVVKALAPEKIGHDVLGKVFHELIPFNIRKAVAAFYTNNEASELLASLSIDKPDATVIDLACGSGTLLVAAYRRKRELLHCDNKGISLEDHKRFLEHDLTGVDIMPFAAHLAVMHLSLQALLHETEKVRIAVWDSTQLKPKMSIPAIFSELKAAYRKPTLDMFKDKFVIPEDAHIKKGAVTLEGVGGEEIPLEKVDLVMMNPPFTRQQRIPKEYKAILARRFKDNLQYIHGQIGYHGYFILLADRFVKDMGRIALVLPATVLNADGFQGLRKFLTERYSIEHIVTVWQRAAFSEGAQFREILLVARKQKPSMKSKACAVTELKRMPNGMQEARDFATKMQGIAKRKTVGTVFEDDNMQISMIAQSDMQRNSDNLFKLIAFKEKNLIKLWFSILDKGRGKLTQFGKYLDKHNISPKEGAALGQILKGGGIGALYINRLVDEGLKKTDVWIVKSIERNYVVAEHRFLKQTLKIPTRALRLSMRRFSGETTIDVSQRLDYMVVDRFADVDSFLSCGLNRKTDKGFISQWKQYAIKLTGRSLLACHVDVSSSGTSALAYYSAIPAIAPRNIWAIDVEDDASKILAVWLNSVFGLFQILLLRKETRGAYIRLDASVIRQIMIPNIDGLPQKTLNLLLQIFTAIQNVEFPSILDQLQNRFSARVETDKTILKLLGYDEEEANRILDYLYPVLASEIERLKTLMEG